MKITTTSENGEIVQVDLYSSEGFKLINEMWIKSSFFHRVIYEPTWLGIPIIQFPNDIVNHCGNIVLAIIMGKTSTKGDGANRENSSTI